MEVYRPNTYSKNTRNKRGVKITKNQYYKPPKILSELNCLEENPYMICVGYEGKHNILYSQTGITERSKVNETPEETASRAIREELGLYCNPMDVTTLTTHKYSTKKTKNCNITYTLVFAENIEPVIQNNSLCTDITKLSGEDDMFNKVYVFVVGSKKSMKELMLNINFDLIKEHDITHFVCASINKILDLMENMCKNIDSSKSSITVKKEDLI